MALPTRTIRFLTTNQVIGLHLHQLGLNNTSLTQPDLLESAVFSPVNLQHYTGQENPFQLAANLAEKIMKNHAFRDGNKRTALLAADVFLRLNGYKLRPAQVVGDDSIRRTIADAHVDIATNAMTAEELGKFYERLAGPVDG